VDLFAAPAAVAPREPSAVERALAQLQPDTLSPREALDALYRLQALQRDST
jgi:DNA mismatch repair protein MutS